MYLLTLTMLFYLAMNSALTVEIQAKLSTAVPIFSFVHPADFQFYNTCYFLKDRAFSCCIVEYFDICCDEVFCHLKSFKQELVRCSLSCYVQSLPQSVLKVTINKVTSIQRRKHKLRHILSRFTLSYNSCFCVNI